MNEDSIHRFKTLGRSAYLFANDTSKVASLQVPNAVETIIWISGFLAAVGSATDYL